MAYVTKILHFEPPTIAKLSEVYVDVSRKNDVACE
jgi:hypothetical protein